MIIPDADLYTNNFRCMFVPKNLSPQQVEEGVWRCTKEFYSFKSMAKRLLLPPGKFTWQGLTENMLFWYGREGGAEIDPVDYYLGRSNTGWSRASHQRARDQLLLKDCFSPPCFSSGIAPIARHSPFTLLATLRGCGV